MFCHGFDDSVLRRERREEGEDEDKLGHDCIIMVSANFVAVAESATSNRLIGNGRRSRPRLGRDVRGAERGDGADDEHAVRQAAELPRQIECAVVEMREDGNGYFRVVLDDPKDHQCLCRASGKLITRKIQLLVGDRVTVELSPYDLGKGRITMRQK